MTIRDTYYEVYFDGEHIGDGSCEVCRDMCTNNLELLFNKDLVEMYKITITEERIKEIT